MNVSVGEHQVCDLLSSSERGVLSIPDDLLAPVVDCALLPWARHNLGIDSLPELVKWSMSRMKEGCMRGQLQQVATQSCYSLLNSCRYIRQSAGASRAVDKPHERGVHAGTAAAGRNPVLV